MITFYDASTGICGDCQSDSDCSGDAICLNNNNPYTNYTNGPSLGGRNSCTSLPLSYTVVLTSEESPDGKEWGKVRTSDFTISHRDAARICSKFGKILPSLSDFGVNCTPPNHCNKTETAKKLAKLHTWASERNGENGLLINLSISDTRLHPYWFTDRGVAQEFFCREK